MAIYIDFLVPIFYIFRTEAYALQASESEMWIESMRTNARGGYAFGTLAYWRDNVNARWYVNGKDYFEAVAFGISAAKSEIFIADWWLVSNMYPILFFVFLTRNEFFSAH